MTNHYALAANLISAALDGHNPNITHHANGTTTIRSRREGGPISDLEELLGELNGPRVNSREVCRELAQQAAMLIVSLSTHHHIDQGEVIDAVRQHAQDASLAAIIPPFLDKDGNVVDRHGNLHPFHNRGDDDDS